MGNYAQPGPQKSNTTRNVVIAIVAICVLICCCLVLIIGALTLLGPAMGKVYSNIDATLVSPKMPSGFPTLSPKDLATISPDMTIPAISDVIPTGGKGDDTQRASAWGYVIIQASLDGCVMSNPKASDTKITVKQDPDSSGMWVEEWTVSCDGGTTKTYTVTFTPSASGTTDIKVK